MTVEIQHGHSYGEAQKCRKRNGRACPPCRRQMADYLAQWRKERPLAWGVEKVKQNARMRAMWRLARMHPVVFRALVDEELAKDEQRREGRAAA
jgi:hypothetical protein